MDLRGTRPTICQTGEELFGSCSFSQFCLGSGHHAFVSVAAYHCDGESISLLQFYTAGRLAQQGSDVAPMGVLDSQRGSAACHVEGHPVRWCCKFGASAFLQLLSRAVLTRLCLEQQCKYSPPRGHRTLLSHFEIPSRPTLRARFHPELRSHDR